MDDVTFAEEAAALELYCAGFGFDTSKYSELGEDHISAHSADKDDQQAD